MHIKVSSGWLPSKIKAMQPVVEVLKMDGFFPDNPRTVVGNSVVVSG